MFCKCSVVDLILLVSFRCNYSDLFLRARLRWLSKQRDSARLTLLSSFVAIGKIISLKNI